MRSQKRRSHVSRRLPDKERGDGALLASFFGQTTILTLTRDRGTGETYCMPHHLTIKDDNRRLMVAALRYYDTFMKADGDWLFAERLLYVDWTEERVLS